MPSRLGGLHGDPRYLLQRKTLLDSVSVNLLHNSQCKTQPFLQ